MSTHAPLPWVACSCGRCGLIWSKTADVMIVETVGHDPEQGRTIGPTARAANSAIIVRAVNAHEDLVTALKRIACDDEPGFDSRKCAAAALAGIR